MTPVLDLSRFWELLETNFPWRDREASCVPVWAVTRLLRSNLVRSWPTSASPKQLPVLIPADQVVRAK